MPLITFVPDTLADATQVNANFNAVYNQGDPLPFSQVGWGPNQTNAWILDRIPLFFNTQVLSAAVVGAAITAGAAFNVVYGDAAEAGSVPANGIAATLGQSVWAADQGLPASLAVATFAAPTTGFFPAGGWLSLRGTSPAAGGASNLKVVLRVVILS